MMKLFFIGSQLAIVHAMLFKYRATYNPKLDSFKVEAIVIPALILALFMQDRPPTIIGMLFEVSTVSWLITNAFCSTFGPFLFCWNRWLSCLKCSSYKRLAKLNQSPRITCYAWACTVSFTF